MLLASMIAKVGHTRRVTQAATSSSPAAYYLYAALRSQPLAATPGSPSGPEVRARSEFSKLALSICQRTSPRSRRPGAGTPHRARPRPAAPSAGRTPRPAPGAAGLPGHAPPSRNDHGQATAAAGAAARSQAQASAPACKHCGVFQAPRGDAGPPQAAVHRGGRSAKQFGHLGGRLSSTSRRISIARCRADRYCSAATKVSRMPATPA